MKFTIGKKGSRRGCRRACGRGFTLVEVMMAMMVLAFGITGSVTVLRIGFDMVETSRDQTMVGQILQSEIETLRLMTWHEISDLPETEAFQIETEFDQTIGDRFTCIRRIEDARPGVEIKTVVLEVTWTTTNGAHRELAYETRIARNGINDYYYRSL